MKIAIMTDLEGVAGVIDSVNWCHSHSRYYEIAKELLTEEVNAAINGFRSGGANEFFVIDGHGCGAIDIRLLDEDAQLSRGWVGPWPFGIDTSFDAVAWVGQHAKAGTEKAHLCHTGSMNKIDYSVNGLSIGEFGMFAFCAAELGIPSIFGSGDEAFTVEAYSLIPGIETVSVKRGVAVGAGEECDPDQYRVRNAGAVHLQPRRARKLIEQGAKTAAQRFAKGEFKIILPTPPYESNVTYRHEADKPRREIRHEHPTSFIGLLNS
ncbi:MAG: M55 family metallopeptidase [Armatimonadetes bacterium]|jgi:D-amino peptidase|nr:M55 family metallopeptidase [Armatimonadota bacterium]